MGPASDPGSSPPATGVPITSQTSAPKVPLFPPSNAPRVWFLTDGLSPVALSLSRVLLDHGDYVIAGVQPDEFATERGDNLRSFLAEAGTSADLDVEVEQDVDEMEDSDSANGSSGPNGPNARKKWKERFRILSLDTRSVLSVQRAHWTWH
jgi:hypothetical protein